MAHRSYLYRTKQRFWPVFNKLSYIALDLFFAINHKIVIELRWELTFGFELLSHPPGRGPPNVWIFVITIKHSDRMWVKVNNFIISFCTCVYRTCFQCFLGVFRFCKVIRWRGKKKHGGKQQVRFVYTRFPTSGYSLVYFRVLAKCFLIFVHLLPLVVYPPEKKRGTLNRKNATQ